MIILLVVMGPTVKTILILITRVHTSALQTFYVTRIATLCMIIARVAYFQLLSIFNIPIRVMLKQMWCAQLKKQRHNLQMRAFLSTQNLPHTYICQIRCAQVTFINYLLKVFLHKVGVPILVNLTFLRKKTEHLAALVHKCTHTQLNNNKKQHGFYLETC